MGLCPRLQQESIIAQIKNMLHVHQKIMTLIVFQDTKDIQPHPRALQIISIGKANHLVDHAENSDLQVRGQGLDLREVCTEF